MSRYTLRVHKARIKKQSRTIPLRGHKDFAGGRDDGRYWKCWNCGFICDVERDELGDSESVAGISHTIYEAQYGGAQKNDGDYNETDAKQHGTNSGIPLLTMASIRSQHVLMENDSSGTPATIRSNWTPQVNSGCPFCGTKNWRGDY